MKSKAIFAKNQPSKYIQDEIFRRMSAEQKIRLAGGLFRLAQKLETLKKAHDTRNIIKKNRTHPQSS